MDATGRELNTTLAQEMRDETDHLKQLPEDREFPPEYVARLEEMRSRALELVHAIEAIFAGLEGRPHPRS